MTNFKKEQNEKVNCKTNKKTRDMNWQITDVGCTSEEQTCGDWCNVLHSLPLTISAPLAAPQNNPTTTTPYSWYNGSICYLGYSSPKCTTFFSFIADLVLCAIK